MIMMMKPQRRQIGPKSGPGKIAFELVSHRSFEVIITIAILCNVVVMSLNSHDQSRCFSAALFWANVGFASVYFIEAILKVSIETLKMSLSIIRGLVLSFDMELNLFELQITGLGIRWYFRDTWNRFDFSLVLLSICTVTLDSLNHEYYCGEETFEIRVNFPGLAVFRVHSLAAIFL